MNPSSLSVAEPAGSIEPSAPMRIIWTPWSLWPATRAYLVPFISNVAKPWAPASSPKPLVGSVPESVAKPASTKVPFPVLMRISWTPFSPQEAVIAYVLPPSSNASMSFMPSRLPKVLSSTLAAEPLPSRVPPGRMRISWTPPLDPTTA